MTNIAIRVENLGKQYKIGRLQQRHDTLRDQLSAFLKSRYKGNGQNQKSEESIWALKDVSFDVQWGEALGIIGRNGAGKSTALKILSRITEPTEGSAEINGRVGSLLEVGTGFHPELTGRENVYLNGAILGMRRAEILRKFDEIVDFAEIARFIDTPVKRYSSGMYVRLAFAVAAYLDPEILLVDEVLAVGDAAFQKKCLGRIQDVTRAGRTVLFVSHNLGAIESLCSRVIWLDAGTIRGIGKASSVISNYLLESAGGAFTPNSLNPYKTNEKFSIEQVLFKDEFGTNKVTFSPGENVTIEVQFYAAERIGKPHLWIGISSQYGSLFGADMTVDGYCPAFVEKGHGRLECAFKMPILLPQTFTVRMGVREKDALTPLTKTAEVGAFRIEATAADYGLHGPMADVSLLDASPLFIPYEWRLPDCRVAEVNYKRHSIRK